MIKLMRKGMFPAVAVLVIAAALAYAFWPRPVTVDLVTAARGPMQVTIEDEGETRVKEVYVISAPLSGRVDRFEGHVGDSVVAGESVVAAIRPTAPSLHDFRTHSELEAAVKAAAAARDLAQAHVASAMATDDYARVEFERIFDLQQRGTAPQSLLDRARMETRRKKAELTEARAALRVREYELQTAEAAMLEPTAAERATADALCCFEVRAPVSGTILRVYRESEAVVQAGAPLVEIGDPQNLEIVVDLLSTDAVLTSEGDDVLIEGWGGEQNLKGEVRRIEPFGFTKTSALGIEEQRVNVIVDLIDPPDVWSRLGHGYRVVCRIVIWRGEEVLQVPLSAIFRSAAGWALFKAVDGEARLSNVEVGHMSDSHGEILAGLSAGDTVLTHPSDSIADGVDIIARAAR